MSDVFVSYSRDDREIVARIVTALEAAGENVWVDLEDIAPSAMWMDEIKTAIAGADSMVFFLSPDSAASEVCRAELDHAVLLAKRIVPVLIRDVSDVTVPAPLPDINWHAIGSQTFDADVARLVEVLNTDIARVHQHTRLLVRATEWEGRDGDASLLLHGSQLAEAEKWLEGQTDQKPTTTPVQARFIAASRRAATGRQRKWSIAAVTIATIFAVVAGFAIVQWRTASHQRQIATHERDVAVSSQLAIEAQNALAVDPQLALLLALRAYDSAPTPASQDAVRDAVRLSTLRAVLPKDMVPAGRLGHVQVAERAFSSSGNEAVVTTDQSVAVWDWADSTADAPRAPVTLGVPAALGDVMGAEFRGDNRVVFATRKGAVYEWDWARGAAPDTMSQLAQVGRNPQLGAGGTMVVTVEQNTVVVTPLGANAPPPTTFDVGRPVHDVGFSYKGELVATNSNGTVDVWSLATKARVTPSFTLGESDGGALAFTPDNRRLAVGFLGSVKVVDLQKHDVVRTLTIDTPAGLPAHCCDVDEPTALAWDPDGSALAAATSDSTVRVWVGDASTPVYLNGDTSAIGGVAFNSYGRYLLSGGGRPEVRNWQAGSPLIYAGKDFSPPVVAPEGFSVAVADGDGNALFAAARTWSIRRLTRGIPLAYSPDGDRLAIEEPGAVVVWDIVAGAPVGKLPVSNPGFDARPGYPRYVASFDPTGTVLALLDQNNRPAKLLRWQWKSTAPAQQVSGNFGNNGVQALVGWSDGAIHYIVRGQLESWDGTSSPRVLAALPEPTGDIDQAAYLSSRKILLTYGQQTRVWDLDARTVTEVLPHIGSSQFALSGDQAVLAVSGDDGYVHTWDLQPGDPPIEIDKYTVAPHIALSGDGERLAVASTKQLVVVPTRFSGPFPAVLDLARSLVARHLTPDEGARYLPGS